MLRKWTGFTCSMRSGTRCWICITRIRVGSFGAGLHRPVLLHHLLKAMAGAAVDVRWGWEIEEVTRSGNRWNFRSADGKECDGFDLLVVADGARSKLRDLVGNRGVNRGYPWGAHWFIGTNDGVFPENELYQVVNGTRKPPVFATGRDLDGGAPLVSLFWSVRIEDDAAWRARPLDEWKQEILALCPKSAGLWLKSTVGIKCSPRAMATCG